ncbi:MAG: phage/plasmid primase, P4 family [Planctomycetes bacterium]|nr:phage/plasmid primase, P4 family [Planctomycetota bacterium]
MSAAASSPIAALKRWRQEWYLWRRELGFWDRKESEWMRVQAGRFMNSMGVSHTEQGKTNLIGAVQSLVYLGEKVRPPCWIGSAADKMDPKHVYVSFRNGVLDLDAWLKTGQMDKSLFKHSPDFWTRCGLPYDFDPSAKCPRFMEAVQQWQPDGDAQLLLCAWAGYCFVPGHPQQCFLLNIGPGGDGKSQYATVLTALVGEENVGSVGLEAFDPKQQFGLEPLLGKTLNITADANDLDRVGEGVLKAIVGGDSVAVNRKHIAALHEPLPCKFMMNANQLPPFRDRSEGIWRRLLLLNWRPVPEGKRIRDFGRRIVESEIAGVFNWALTGYEHVKAKGFDDLRGERVKAWLAEARSEVQKERQFFEECIGFDPVQNTKKLSKEALYFAYEEYCKANGIKKGLYGDNVAKAMMNFLRERFPEHAGFLDEKCKVRHRVAEEGSRQRTFYAGVWLLSDPSGSVGDMFGP